MKSVLLLLSLLPAFAFAAKASEAAAAAAAASKEESSSNVVVLTKSNFASFLKENPLTLVEFYAPWCGHCQKLTPEYEKAAEKLKDKKVPLAKVDATTETELAQEFEIGGYPTLKFFRNGKPEDYGGGRTAETIVSWVESMTGPAVSEFSDKNKAIEFAKEANIAFLGTFSNKDSAEYKTFEEVAEHKRQQGKFAALIDGSASKVGEVTVWRKGEGAVTSTSNLNNKTQFESFVNTERFPLFGPINVNNYADYFGNNKEMIWFAGEKDDYEKHGAALREAAGSFRDKYNFVWLDTATFKDHAQSSLGVKEFPALVLQAKAGRFVYTGTGGSGAAAANMFESGKPIKKFLDDVAAGKVDKHYMSDAVPETNDEPVKVVVGKTFESMILHPTRDALLEVYAPWCGHCKKFEPIYTEFAESMSSRSDELLIAKMDGTTNEAPVPNFEWRGFPTIFFVKAGTDKPITFDGARTVEALTEFVDKHSTSKKGSGAKDESKEEL